MRKTVNQDFIENLFASLHQDSESIISDCKEDRKGRYYAIQMTVAAETIMCLAHALLPFSKMHRERSVNKDGLACERGIGFDRTIITNEDFERAWTALNS